MKKILFCGGGSAGHVIPKIAFFVEFKEFHFCFIGTDGIEEKKC